MYDGIGFNLQLAWYASSLGLMRDEFDRWVKDHAAVRLPETFIDAYDIISSLKRYHVED